ncbi:MAG: hypothetical protein BroJett003_11120 [Planctomycetota bacterium]|nr:MAG: hypothetical protein BroJett003_11120 [Planctomycetota bacterium]
MRPYSMDLRERVVTACDAREGTREKIAERFGVSTAWIRRVLQRRRESGSIAPRPQNPGRKRAIRGRQLDRLRRLVERRPDATLRELKAGLRMSVSDGAMLRALATLGLTLKKSRSRLRNKNGKR